MRKRIDLTGQVFGKLTVLGRMFAQQQGNTYWQCQCECGATCSIAHSNLKTGSQLHCSRLCPMREVVSAVKGKSFARTRLDKDQRETLKAVWAEGKYTQRELAEMFGVSRLTVLNIVNGKTHQEKEEA